MRNRNRNPSSKRLSPVQSALQPRLELTGNRELVVDGCGGVLEYSSETVRIRYGRMVLRLTGRGLIISSLGAKSLVVSGFLMGIEFVA